ncbi:MAG: TetR/AcrR family transcriptional regulator [Deltaproteobacteria bacterium]|nr:TetR/AcrR family transcriptional regulator [Deltaproteobacteria bacterium]
MPRNREQNELMRSQRTEQILAASLKLFARRGLSATKISDIAAETGMSQGLIYHYYSSKEEIYTEIIKDAFRRLNEAVTILKNIQLPPEEKIKKAFEGLLINLEKSDDSARYHYLVAQASVSDAIPEGAKKTIMENRDYPYQIMEEIIREGQEQGTIKKYDPNQMSVIFWTTIKGLAFHRAVLGNRFKAPSADILMEMFI